MAEIQQTIATVLVFDVTGLSPIFSPNTSACAKYPSARRNTPIDAVLLYVVKSRVDLLKAKTTNTPQSSGGAMVKDEESLDYWWFANEWKRRSFESSKQGQ
ncbi:uncharacterized protein EAF01_000287 [Botrytis porri]|uniref:uncharacterized protein n=1 Tax=Botrytis porri TaxID=87229 RepID=UPI001900B667|nr:uncharacterized protein EAF01_000287 [Botrytis porri]KAF7913881.1 hypothetical protein EAF01_000287 [Botrytis porri]